MQKRTQSAKAKKQQQASQPKQTWVWLVLGVGLIAVIIFAFLRLAPYTATEISVNDAQKKLLQPGIFFLDVRTQTEWDEQHIANNTLIPLDQLAARLAEVPKDQEVVIVCRSGRRAKEAAAILKNAGYSSIFPMTGGLLAWTAAGFAVDKGGQ